MKLFWIFVFLIFSANSKFRRLDDDLLEEKEDRYQYEDQLPDPEENIKEDDEEQEFNVDSLNDPEYFVESHVTDEEAQEEVPEEADMIEFEQQNEEEHLKNFKKISDDLSYYEDDYTKCLNKIPDSSYTQKEIDYCVGKDFIKVLNDIRYESMKLLSRGDAKIRDVMIDLCYVPAGEDEVKSQACDLLEKDALDLLWASLKVVEIVIANKEKYTENQGEMEKPLFRNIMIEFDKFQQEFFELLNEIDDHKAITLLKLKGVIDERTKLIRAKARDRKEEEPQEKHEHEIIIEETEELPKQETPDVETENLDEGTSANGDQEEAEFDEGGRRKLLSEKKNLQDNKNKLPIHKDQQFVVRQIPNKMRIMNHNGKYDGISHNQISNRKNFRDENFLDEVSKKMLQGVSLRNKLGMAKFKNVHRGNKKRHNMFK